MFFKKETTDKNYHEDPRAHRIYGVKGRVLLEATSRVILISQE